LAAVHALLGSKGLHLARRNPGTIPAKTVIAAKATIHLAICLPFESWFPPSRVRKNLELVKFAGSASWQHVVRLSMKNTVLSIYC
jgi:hypothetical protein